MPTPPPAKDPDVLGRALGKQAAGRGTSNTEKRALSDFERGKIGRDHFAKIATAPTRADGTKDHHRPAVRSGDPSTQIGAGKDRLQSTGTAEVDLTAILARVAALETILASYADTTLDVCVGGSPVSKVFLTK
jgi:hypothetical protein